jgi:ubiquinone/menaquinone biosynthesis C-methylase UbiE
MRFFFAAAAIAAGAIFITLRPNTNSASVEQEYDESGATFDERWRVYINVTVDAMLARVGPQLDALPCAAASCRVLDVGCGTGALAHTIARRFPLWNVTCSDLSAEMLKGAAAKGLAVVQARSEALPFPDGAFDAVTSLSSFHFWDAPLEGLQELNRVLVPGGKLLLSDWAHDYVSCKICGWYLWAAGFPANDWNILSSARLRDLLRAARFEIADEQIYQVELRPFGLRVCPRWGMMVFSATRS